MFRTIENIKTARRKGLPLFQIINEILVSKLLLSEYQENLFSILKESIQTIGDPEADWIDFTSENWLHLSHQKQTSYANAYQRWYTDVLSEEVETTFSFKPLSLEMVLIPPGKFWMGSPVEETGRGIDEERYLAWIREPFWIGKYPFTREQWEILWGTEDSFQIQSEAEEIPIKNVSWLDCDTLLKKIKGEPLRLLKEFEWEYACRAGTLGRYCFDEQTQTLGDYAWYLENSDRNVHPVGEKKGNAFGVFDLHGNVWEWCSSVYQQRHSLQEIEFSPDLPLVESLVIRGGSYSNSSQRCRSAQRHFYRANARTNYIGFRVAASYT